MNTILRSRLTLLIKRRKQLMLRNEELGETMWTDLLRCINGDIIAVIDRCIYILDEVPVKKTPVTPAPGYVHKPAIGPAAEAVRHASVLRYQ